MPELMVGAYLTATAAGDWRASASLLERVYGTPRERVEVEMPRSVERVETLSLSQIRALRGQLELVSAETQ
jgi:hypothetical protein